MEQLYERLSDHDLAGVGELLSEDCSITVADRELDRERYREFLDSFFTGFPDLRNTTDEVIAEGDAVASARRGAVRTRARSSALRRPACP